MARIGDHKVSLKRRYSVSNTGTAGSSFKWISGFAYGGRGCGHGARVIVIVIIVAASARWEPGDAIALIIGAPLGGWAAEGQPLRLNA